MPWSANVCVAGMPVRAARFEHLFESPLAFPCVLAQGTADPFYPWCRRLARQYAAPELIEYDEGHRFPHAKEANARLVGSVKRALAASAREL